MVAHETRDEIEAQARRLTAWLQIAWNNGHPGAPITEQMAGGIEVHMAGWLPNVVLGALDEESVEGRARRRFLAALRAKAPLDRERVEGARRAASGDPKPCESCGGYYVEVARHGRPLKVRLDPYESLGCRECAPEPVEA